MAVVGFMVWCCENIWFKFFGVYVIWMGKGGEKKILSVDVIFSNCVCVIWRKKFSKCMSGNNKKKK